MPGYPGAPSVQTVTDKLATFAPELGNIPGIYVYLREHLSRTVYEAATPTDSGGNVSIAGVPAGLYQYSYGIHPNTAYEFKGSYLVALNPAIGVDASPVQGVIRPWGAGLFDACSPLNPSGKARGDGVTSDAAAFQGMATAACAANGKMLITPPPGGANNFLIDATITIQPASGAQVYTDIEAHGAFTTINWQGANSIPIFKSFGWKHSKIEGVKIQIPATSTGVIAWELDVDGTRTSSAQLTFKSGLVTMLNGATSCVAFRMGHGGGATGGTELSFLQWENYHVNGGNNANSNIAWVNEHPNGLNYTWMGGSGLLLGKLFTTSSTAGAAAANGGDSMFFYGLGGSTNLMDFETSTTGLYAVYGGRFEAGTTFFRSLSGSTQKTITVAGTKIATYAAGAVFDFNSADSVTLLNIQANGTAYTAAFITLHCFTGQGVVKVIGGGIRGSDPPYTISSGTWRVSLDNVGILNASNQATTWFAPLGVAAITVTASPFTYTNSDGVREAIYIDAGTVTVIAKNAITVFTTTGHTIWLDPLETVTVTYSVAPTMNKDRKY